MFIERPQEQRINSKSCVSTSLEITIIIIIIIIITTTTTTIIIINLKQIGHMTGSESKDTKADVVDSTY